MAWQSDITLEVLEEFCDANAFTAMDLFTIVSMTMAHCEEARRQYRREVRTDPLRYPKYRNQRRRYFKNVKADPVRYAKYCERRRLAMRRQRALRPSPRKYRPATKYAQLNFPFARRKRRT